MEKTIKILKTAMWCVFGVFIGRCLYGWYDFHVNSRVYEMMSRPWYTSFLINGVYTVAVETVLFVIIFILKRVKKK